MNPYRLKDVFNYLTSNNQLLKRKLKLGTDEIPTPPKRSDVTTIEAINRFNKANPRVDTTNLKPLSVKQSNVRQSNVDQADEGVIQGAFDTATREAQSEGFPAPKYEAFKKRYLRKNMKADGGRIGYKDGEGVITIDDKIDEMISFYKDYLNQGGKMDFQTFSKKYIPENFADGGRIGYKDGPKMFDVQASGSKSGKQQIENAPEGITSDKETINAILTMDIPLTEKVNLIGNLKYGKFRDKIEYKDNEIFLEDPASYRNRNIGLDYNRGGEGFSGSATVGDEGPEFNIRYKKSFADGGMLVQSSDDGSRPGYAGREYSTVEFDKFSDDVLKAYAEDDITKIMNPKYKTNINRVKINKFNNLDNLIKKTGLDEETIFDLFDDREAFQDLELSEDVWKRGRQIDPDKAKFYKQAENWIIKNSKRYADPDKFKKAFIRTFGKNNDITQKINRPDKRMLMRVPFSDWFRTNIMGSSDDSMRNQVKPSYNSNQLDNIFKTAIYTNNKNVRNQIINELTNILPEKGSKRTPDIREKFKNSPILKKFNLNERIVGPIARLLAKEVGEDLLKQVSLFRRPFLGTTELITYLKNKVNPKYKSMFEEAAKATIFAQKNSWPEARKALNYSNSIMFDHKIPKALINAGYADEIEYIKLNPTSAEFNANIKRAQFDQPMIKLINEFERAKNLDGKAKVVEKMNQLKNNFSKKYGGYLDEVSIVPDKTGKPIFKSSASPVTKKTDFISSLGKSMFQAGEVDEKNFKRLIASFGGGTCSVFSGKKADGGRIGLSTGTPNIDDCFKSGTAVINSGKVSVDKADDFTQLLKRAGNIGRGIMKFGIIPEAMFAAADSLVRMGMGDTFKEAGLRATDYLLPGDQTKAAEISKVSRVFGDTTGELVGRTIDYKNQLAKIQSLEEQISNLDNLSDVGEFDYMGDLSGESNTKKNLLSKAKNDLDNKFKISEAEQLFAERKQEEAYDASSANSPFTKLKARFRDSSDGLSDIETLGAPEKTQMQLNLDMLPTVPRDYMTATDDQIINFVNKENLLRGKKQNPQLYIDERDKLKKDFMTKGPAVYGAENVYGAQGIFSEPLLKTIAAKQNSIDDLEREAVGQRNKFNVFDRDTSGLGTGLRGFSAASGGIASLTKTIPPESGPTPHGLRYPYNNVKKIKE